MPSIIIACVIGCAVCVVYVVIEFINHYRARKDTEEIDESKTNS